MTRSSCESYLVHASRGKKPVGEKGKTRKGGGVKIMFRERVINRQDENKARTCKRGKRERKREKDGWTNGRTDKSRSLCPAKVTSVVRSSQTKIVKEFRDQRPRHLSCILNLVVASIVVVVVFHRLAPLSAAAASFAWSPTSNRDFTSRRASSRFGRAEKNAARRETLIIIMIRFNLFCHAD